MYEWLAMTNILRSASMPARNSTWQSTNSPGDRCRSNVIASYQLNILTNQYDIPVLGITYGSGRRHDARVNNDRVSPVGSTTGYNHWRSQMSYLNIPVTG
jgi:hypothetical protein